MINCPRTPVFTIAAVLIGIVTPQSAPAQEAEVTAFLTDHAGFSDKDLEKLNQGEAIARIVKTGDNREVMVEAAVRVNAPVDFIADRFTRIASMLSTDENVRSVGQFAIPPSAADVAELELPKDDVSDLEKCKAGDCNVKLPADVIDILNEQVDWSSDDAGNQTNQFFREAAVQYLSEYQASGDRALATYDDKKEPLSVAEGLALLLSETPYLLHYEPSLHRYMAEFPSAPSEGIEDVFYWIVADFGLKPVFSVKHLALARSTESPVADAIVLIKEIYSSHYFQAGIAVIILTEVTGSDGTANTIATYMGRQRFDGKVSGIKRQALEDKVRDNARDQLRDGKSKLDQAYAASRGG